MSTAVRVGEFVVDEETGEVLEIPSDVTEPLSWLIVRALDAQEQSKTWERAYNLYRLAVGRKLEAEGLKGLQTEHGRAYWTGRTDRRAKAERLPAIAARHELSSADVQVIVMHAAASLDAKRLDELAEKNPRYAEAIKELIEESRSEWVQFSKPRKLAPEIGEA